MAGAMQQGTGTTGSVFLSMPTTAALKAPGKTRMHLLNAEAEGTKGPTYCFFIPASSRKLSYPFTRGTLPWFALC